jgi:hypothetical protein
MLTLYCTHDCDQLEDELDSLCLAHRTVHLPPDMAEESVPDGVTPPALIDDGQVFEGEDEIRHHVEELQEFRAQWDLYQSDACYCNENGDVL